MIFLLFFCFTLEHYHCASEKFSLKTKPRSVPELNSNKRRLHSTNRQPIRITFDFDLLNPSKPDPLRCDEVGQNITWSEDPQYSLQCTKEMILNAAGRDVITNTLNNVKTYLEKFLSVERLEQNIESTNLENFYTMPSKTYTNTDLVIHVVSRPFADAYYSISTIVSSLETTKRPIEAVICINPTLISSKAENETMRTSNYFFACLHEITHCLGFISTFYEYYHPRDSNTPYAAPLCNLTLYGIKRTYLVTPKAHTYAKRHYNAGTITGDDGTVCPSGIELENSGTEAQQLSHLEARMFYSDYMLAVLIQTDTEPFHRFTDATLAVLLDTGNYDLDYHYMRPLVWGNRDGFPPGSTEVDNFHILPPQEVFPEGYIVVDPTTNYDVCNFDFKSYGNNIMSTKSPDCSKTTSEYCSGKSFYNPKNRSQIADDSIFDFQLIKYPHTCFDGYATIPGNLECLKYVLTDSFVTFTLPKDFRYPLQNITCDSSSSHEFKEYNYINNAGVKKYTKYKCPDFERFRRTINLFNSYFDSDPFDLNTRQQYRIVPDEADVAEESPRESLPTNYIPITPTESSFVNTSDFSYLGTKLTKSTFYGVSITAVLVVVVCMLLCFIGRNAFKTRVEDMDAEESEDGEHKKKRKKRTKKHHKNNDEKEIDLKSDDFKSDHEVKTVPSDENKTNNNNNKSSDENKRKHRKRRRKE